MDPLKILQIAKKDKLSYLELINNNLKNDKHKIIIETSKIKRFNYLVLRAANFHRCHELFIVNLLLKGSQTVDQIEKAFIQKFGLTNQRTSLENAIEHLANLKFSKDNEVKIFLKKNEVNPKIIQFEQDKIFLTKEYYELLKIEEYFKIIKDLIELAEIIYKDNTNKCDQNNLILFNSYTRREIFHLLKSDYSAAKQVGGYKQINSKEVILTAKTDLSSYESYFLDLEHFIWLSAPNRSLEKSTLEKAIVENKMLMHLFVRRSEGEKLYYCGRVKNIKHWELEYFQKRPYIKCILKIKKELPKYLINYLGN